MQRDVLVFGAGGQVGRKLLERAGDFAVGFSHDAVDICDAGEVREAIFAHPPSAIINAAAYTAVDKAETEQDEAYRVNRDGAEILAEAASSARVPFIHLSTDYVFDGKKGRPYHESDAIAPLGVYGRSKAEGEHAVRTRCARHIILRTAWVYSPYGTNFVRTMLRLASERKTLKIVDDQVGCPTAAADIASAIMAVVARVGMEGFTEWGTYHFRGADVVTWYGFACRIFDLATTYGLKIPDLVAISTAEFPTPVRRPCYSVLSVKKLERTFGIKPRVLCESLRECLDQLLGATSRVQSASRS